MISAKDQRQNINYRNTKEYIIEMNNLSSLALPVIVPRK